MWVRRNIKVIVAVAVGTICLCAYFILFLAPLINPERLVYVSISNIISAIFFAFILYAIGVVIASRFSVSRTIFWFSLFFLLRLFMAIFLAMVFQCDDEHVFHRAAIEEPYGITLFRSKVAYYHLVKILYLLFGANILSPKMINVFVGSLLPYFAFDTARWLFGNQKFGMKAFLLTGFLPPFIIFSAVALREIIDCFLFVIIVWVMVNPKIRYIPRLIIWAVCICVLYWLDGVAWTLAGIILVMTYTICSIQPQLFEVCKSTAVLITCLFVLYHLFIEINQMVKSRTTEEKYYIERFKTLGGDTHYRQRAVVSIFLDKEKKFSLQNVVVLFIRGLFSPPPFRFILDYYIATHLESLFMLSWYILFPLMIVILLRYRKEGVVLACGVTTFLILAMVTIGVIVGSDIFRHRMPAMGIVTLLAAGGFEKSTLKCYRYVLLLWIFGAVCFNFLWLFLRLTG